MRIRLLVAAGLIALVGVVASPGVAYAQPDGEAEEHCIELLEEGNKIDDCQEAPNPLIPGVNEIIWGGAAFAILLVVLWKYGIPPIRNMMKQREDRIREDLERAEHARTEAEGELANYRRQVTEARNEAKRQIQAQAEADAAEIRTRAQEDIRLATDRAQADLQGRVADLSIELAEKIVERNLDRDTQLALVESYIGQVGNGSRRNGGR